MIEFNLIGQKPKLKNPILIEGLPGIGNVGKIVADFLVEELKAKKIYEIFSYKLPNSVFVNEKNLVELPSLAIYHKKLKNHDLLILNGDIQPIDEEGCYELCDKVLDLCVSSKCREIITIGGIGLHSEPKQPKIYCTGNSKNYIKSFIKGYDINEKLFGVVGPIIGVSGVLVGMAKKRRIDAIAILAETSAHPMHLGIKGSKEIIQILNKKYSMGIDLKNLDKEVELIEKDNLKRVEKISEIVKRSALKRLSDKMKRDPVDYIG